MGGGGRGGSRLEEKRNLLRSLFLRVRQVLCASRCVKMSGALASAPRTLLLRRAALERATSVATDIYWWVAGISAKVVMRNLLTRGQFR